MEAHRRATPLVFTADRNAAAACGSVWMVSDTAAHPAATPGPHLRRGKEEVGEEEEEEKEDWKIPTIRNTKTHNPRLEPAMTRRGEIDPIR